MIMQIMGTYSNGEELQMDISLLIVVLLISKLQPLTELQKHYPLLTILAIIYLLQLAAEHMIGVALSTTIYGKLNPESIIPVLLAGGYLQRMNGLRNL